MPRPTNLAEQLPEPPDRTRLLIIDRNDKPTAIWRDDAEASTDKECQPDEHWFDDFAEPMDWTTILRYAREVYAVGRVPLATSRPWRSKIVKRTSDVRWEGFAEGDAIWIEDGFSGEPHAAVVTTIDGTRLHAEGPRRPGDSRVPFWVIPLDSPVVISPREVTEV